MRISIKYFDYNGEAKFEEIWAGRIEQLVVDNIDPVRPSAPSARKGK